MFPRLTIVKRAAADSARAGGLKHREWLGSIDTDPALSLSHQKVEIPENEQRSSRLEADLIDKTKFCDYLWGRVRIKGAILISQSSVIKD